MCEEFLGETVLDRDRNGPRGCDRSESSSKVGAMIGFYEMHCRHALPFHLDVTSPCRISGHHKPWMGVAADGWLAKRNTYRYLPLTPRGTLGRGSARIRKPIRHFGWRSARANLLSHYARCAFVSGGNRPHPTRSASLAGRYGDLVPSNPRS